MISEQADEPQKISAAPSALGEKPELDLSQVDWSGVMICYSKCDSCAYGAGDYCFDPPQWHTWAGSDDIEWAKEQGQPDPTTQRCGCWCARADK